MAAGSLDPETLERIATLAVHRELTGAACRAQLLAHLPARFVETIEAVADPVEQLRADVTHLNEHPRLPDHHQPPLATWLQNAYLLTTPGEAAREFRRLRDRLVGPARQQEILRSLTRIKKITVSDAIRIGEERVQPPRAGDIFGGRFSLEKRLGEGAVAEVWRARDLAAAAPVAVKVLKPRWAEDPERRARFFAAARQMAAFAHPHIVPVIIPEGEDGGRFYCVLEYLDAGDLEQALGEERIRMSTGLRALLKVSSGVAALHAASVVHLDIKPQNILLGTDGRVMLGDFDRVRLTAAAGGGQTETVDSVFYLAPETFDERRRPGPTADVFSLGMTALFVLHGDKLPAWIVRRPAALLRRIDCPDPVRRVIARAIALEPAERFGDVETFAVELESALGRPSGALPSIAPLISRGPHSIAPPGAATPPGEGPMPRVAPPPRAPARPSRSMRAISGPPPPREALETGERSAPLSLSDLYDSSNRGMLAPPPPLGVGIYDSGELPALTTPPPVVAPPSRGSLPPPSIPPPSLPPPGLDLPPARTGELELDESVESALDVLDRAAAAAALAEEVESESRAARRGRASWAARSGVDLARGDQSVDDAFSAGSEGGEGEAGIDEPSAATDADAGAETGQGAAEVADAGSEVEVDRADDGASDDLNDDPSDALDPPPPAEAPPEAPPEAPARWSERRPDASMPGRALAESALLRPPARGRGSDPEVAPAEGHPAEPAPPTGALPRDLSAADSLDRVAEYFTERLTGARAAESERAPPHVAPSRADAPTRPVTYVRPMVPRRSPPLARIDEAPVQAPPTPPDAPPPPPPVEADDAVEEIVPSQPLRRATLDDPLTAPGAPLDPPPPPLDPRAPDRRGALWMLASVGGAAATWLLLDAWRARNTPGDGRRPIGSSTPPDAGAVGSAAGPDAAPDAARPDAARPDAQPDAALPDAAPDAAPPDAQPDAAPPDARPDAAPRRRRRRRRPRRGTRRETPRPTPKQPLKQRPKRPPTPPPGPDAPIIEIPDEFK